MRKVPQPFEVLLCICSVFVCAFAGFGQSAKDTITAQNVVSSLRLNQLKEITLLSPDFAVVNAQPLGKFESSSMEPTLLPPPPAPRGKKQGLPHLGVAFTAGTLGFGGQAATAVLRRANVRVGFNYFNYNFPHFGKDGTTYTGALNLRSFEAEFDYYLFGGFHVSPGGLLYNGNKVAATAFIPNGNTFTLGGQQYAAQGNITGTGALPLNRAAPMVKIGFGNLLPRSHRHFTFNFDIGAVFQEAPKVGLSLVGTACNTTTNQCVNAATDAGVQTNIAAEEAKINKNLKFFRYYPVISTSFGWKF